MPNEPSQNYATHRRWYPLYHFVAFPILIANVVFAVRHAMAEPSTWNNWQVALAVGLVVLGWAARAMALRVQNRVIRLEMHLRLARVLPAPLAARASALSARHLVSLRFAGDAELPGLVERCLSGELSGGDDVKKEIKDWQADWLRA